VSVAVGRIGNSICGSSATWWRVPRSGPTCRVMLVLRPGDRTADPAPPWSEPGCRLLLRSR